MSPVEVVCSHVASTKEHKLDSRKSKKIHSLVVSAAGLKAFQKLTEIDIDLCLLPVCAAFVE